ncbi:MAG: N-acetyl-gamma-glutamyl-phosphate reductase [Myxococcaceae bacterium]
MQQIQVGVIGASGYSGIELTRLILGHSKARLQFVTSDRWVGKTVNACTALPSELAYVSNEAGLEAAKGCGVVFLATPAETSLELAPKLRALGVRVVDLAGSFRLQDLSKYPAFYKFEHTSPALLKDAVYGMPELFRERIKGCQFVSNPGCYATAAALSCAPLLNAGLIDPDSIVISAASGVSGAGRKASEEYTFMEIDSDFRAYKTLKHQHVPEIEQTLGVKKLVFTPHLLPMKRGILSTAVARLKKGVGQAQVNEAFSKAYGKEPLVKLLPSADAVRIADVVKTPWCLVGASVDDTHVVSISAIDNLLKGAASQAVQNFNLMLDFDEVDGLRS